MLNATLEWAYGVRRQHLPRWACAVDDWRVACCRWFSGFRTAMLASKQTAATLWLWQRSLRTTEGADGAAGTKALFTRTTGAYERRHELHIDLTSCSDVSATGYADYLALHLTHLHSQIGRRLRKRRVIDADTENFMVFQIRALSAHPLVTQDQAVVLVPYLDYRNPRIAEAARQSYLDISGRRVSVVTVEAKIELVTDDVVVMQFEHPALGVVERQFDRKALPSGVKEGDCCDLGMELDGRGCVVGYRLIGTRLVKRLQAEWEALAVPPAPKSIHNMEDMARYDEAMDAYMLRTTEMRAREAAHWRARRKS